MADYCLPKQQVEDLLDAIRDKRAPDLFDLQELSSDNRRRALEEIVGPDNAQEINTLFEQKMLLRYKWGLNDWLQKVTDVSEQTRKTIADKINGLDERILNPENEKSFLSDLANDKLGFNVTQDEAKQIFDATKNVQDLKKTWEQTLSVDVSSKDFYQIEKSQRTTGPSYDTPVEAAVSARSSYGKALVDLRDTVEEMKPNGHNILDVLLNVWNSPKTTLTGVLHFSALGVQGWGSLPRPVAGEAFMRQFEYFKDPENYKTLQAYTVSHPDYKYLVDGKLAVTDISVHDVANRDEQISSPYPQELNEWVARVGGKLFGQDKPLPINVMAASSRAFSGALNYLKIQQFYQLIEASRRDNPENIRIGSQNVKDIASVVNNFTGRANVNFGNLQRLINGVFFAPSKVAADFQMFNPQFHVNLALNAIKTGDNTAQYAALDRLTSAILTSSALMTLATTMGYHVNTDATNQDFGKVVFSSREKLDITGGKVELTRLMAQLTTGKVTTSAGVAEDLNGAPVGQHPITRADLIGRYVRGKLGPSAGLILDALIRTDAIGRPVTFGQEARDKIEPILLQSILNYYYDQPDKAMTDMPGLSAAFGWNLESPLPPSPRLGMNAWGEPQSDWSPHNPEVTHFDRQLKNVGYVQHFPAGTINSIKLTDEQYKQYIHLTGTFTKVRIQNYINNPGWGEMSQTEQLKKLKGLQRDSENLAQIYVKGASLHGPNDIIQQSLDNIKKKMGLK